MVIGTILDSPDFVYLTMVILLVIRNVWILKPVFSTILNQKITIVDEKYAFLDNSTVFIQPLQVFNKLQGWSFYSSRPRCNVTHI